jgi:aryl-alcohol dehydrogenase (NADP+)
VLDDSVLDSIDALAAPGVDIAPLEGAAYTPPAITRVELRRRPLALRAVA